MGVRKMERHLVICDCGSCEHQMILTFFPPDEDEPFLSVSFHLITYENIFWRIWTALKFILGYRSRYGEWDEIILDKVQAAELSSFLDKFAGENLKTAECFGAICDDDCFATWNNRIHWDSQ